MEHTVDVLIVGGGPAGDTAALYCARAGLETLVLEGTAHGGQMRATMVENYPGVETVIEGDVLAERMRRAAEHWGARSQPAQVTALEVTEKEVLAQAGGASYRAKALIYAAGAAPRTLDIPGEAALTGRGVSYCAACDGAFFKNRTVVVAGGGNSAAEEALALARLCRQVYLIHRRDKLRAEQTLQAALAATDNLTLLLSCRPEAILGEQTVTGLRYYDLAAAAEKTLPCDGVFVAVGRRPNTALLEGQVQLDPNGYVVADETCRTERPRVFAAGDVRAKPLRQIVTAAADGAVAAHFAAEYLAAASSLP